MRNIDPSAHVPESQNDGVDEEASVESPDRISRYIGPLVVSMFGAQAVIADGICEIVGADGPAEGSFIYAGVCALGALCGALYVRRKDQASALNALRVVFLKYIGKSKCGQRIVLLISLQLAWLPVSLFILGLYHSIKDLL